ncbi:MAG: Stp1/IreP family PP2C-type Ser/Thr phosphatase [Solirubrobacteraceae bacterium]|jgi:PPM family protein phosphatase
MLRAAETIERTDTGRQRRGNEDSSLARAPLFVVADGMGGAQAGEVASRMAVELFAQGLPDSGGPEERLATVVQAANEQIYERAHSEHQLAGMGTTLTAAYLDDAHLSIAHVGDSRAYLFRDGQLKRLTQDHSLVDELVREGKLTEEQAAEHPQRSIITRALGPEAQVTVDTWTYPARAGDVVLLCSDGLTSMLSEERISQILNGAASLEAAADQLIADANAAGGRDNITVVAFRVEDTGPDGQLDQPTVVGPSAPQTKTEADQDTVRPADAAARAAPTMAPPDGGASSATRVRPAVKVPLARTQGTGSHTVAEPPRRSRRYAKPIAALLAVLIVLALVLGGGYLATRQLYFIGTNSHGIVTIYRGLPYDLPAGVHLYETFYTSGVPAAALPSDRQRTLLNNHLRSQNDAQTLMRDIELGQLTR